jgi:cell wall-associated NlpC family hydrolase
MPRLWRWLVPLTALMACVLPRAGASAAPLDKPDAPLPRDEERAATDARAATLRALVERKEQRREQAARDDGVVESAKAQIGDGYAYGGSGPDGFDCSGLTAFAFARAGLKLPHSSYAQAAMGEPVARGDIRPGDLVFFSTAGSGASHVAVATGRNTAVSATNAGVIEHSTVDAYWGGHYVTARRLR